MCRATGLCIISQSIDSKREEFRKYLESGGVTDAMIRILTMIMEHEDPIPDLLQYPLKSS